MTDPRDLLPMLRAMWPDILDPNRLFVLSRVPDEAAYCRLHAWHLSELAAAEENGRLSAAFSSKPNPAIDALWHAAEAAALERAIGAISDDDGLTNWDRPTLQFAVASIRQFISPTARTALAERDERMREEGRQEAVQWQPVGTAPRGEVLLVWGGSGEIFRAFFRYADDLFFPEIERPMGHWRINEKGEMYKPGHAGDRPLAWSDLLPETKVNP